MLIGRLTARRSGTQLPKHIAPRGSLKAAANPGCNGRVDPPPHTPGRRARHP